MNSSSADIQVFLHLRTPSPSSSHTSVYSHKLDGFLKALLIISEVNAAPSFFIWEAPHSLPPLSFSNVSAHFKSLGTSSEDSTEISHCKQLFWPWFFDRDFSRFILLGHESNFLLSQWCFMLHSGYAIDPQLELNVDYSLQRDLGTDLIQISSARSEIWRDLGRSRV